MTFCVFIAVQFFFALIYLRLYKIRESNFVFNGQISERQIEHTRDEYERIQTAVTILRELRESLNNGVSPARGSHDETAIVLSSGYTCSIQYHASVAMGPPPSSTLNIHDSQGKSILTMVDLYNGLKGWLRSASRIETNADWTSAVSIAIPRCEIKLSRQMRRMESLSVGSPDIWSDWDFLYFSTVIQTTVGLGDILPNSTSVRMVVAAQIMLGYALLVVVLNAVFGPG
jgi:hypothetical protein